MQIEAAHNITTSQIIGAAIDVHRMLGPGLLESIYAGCLKRELHDRTLRYVSERSIPVVYKGTTLDLSYRIDLIVEDCIVVEVKSVASVLPVHEAQLLTYLKLTACPIGLLINFNEAKLVDGVHRLVNPA
jgi:GxxExxY protein